jgi:hypothetical protein
VCKLGGKNGGIKFFSSSVSYLSKNDEISFGVFAVTSICGQNLTFTGLC